MWCDQTTAKQSRLFLFFLMFVQSFNCLYLWNKLPNLSGVFTKLKLYRKCQKTIKQTKTTTTNKQSHIDENKWTRILLNVEHIIQCLWSKLNLKKNNNNTNALVKRQKKNEMKKTVKIDCCRCCRVEMSKGNFDFPKPVVNTIFCLLQSLAVAFALN